MTADLEWNRAYLNGYGDAEANLPPRPFDYPDDEGSESCGRWWSNRDRYWRGYRDGYEMEHRPCA